MNPITGQAHGAHGENAQTRKDRSSDQEQLLQEGTDYATD